MPCSIPRILNQLFASIGSERTSIKEAGMLIIIHSSHREGCASHRHSHSVLLTGCADRLHLLVKGFTLVLTAVLPCGMVGEDRLSNQIADDILSAVVGGIHHGLELAQEGVLVKGNGAANMDQLIGGRAQAFLAHQLFFIKLLSLAQARVGDLNIQIRLESGQSLSSIICLANLENDDYS